ncbi:substrate-binding domain-containing protein [Streptomyces sp. NBC_00878]|uniref:sugar ABC transporter substrate-binding protein n=1 Tax=Streptomyces sp. NBC_00878 TaxID=2975854 RepID=UPI002250532D|nr:substrate-binding domain-containing protein [Streptomyces sp. NBC_00878]MCX4903842.1 substrate-binding domain-containing protein [Streptomyces sp. NBC_00878]
MMDTRSHSLRRLRILLLAGAAAMALMLSGCSSSDAKQGSDRPGGTSDAHGLTIDEMKAEIAKHTGMVSSYPAQKQVSGVEKLRGKTIWYVPVGATAPILNTFGDGIKAAFDKLGITFHMCDGEFLPTTMASCLNEAASRGADGVVTGYIDYALIPNAFDNLVAQNIPVLIAGAQPSRGKTNSPELAFYDTTPTINVLQKLSSEAVIVDSGGKAKVLYIGVTDSPQTKAMAAYAKQFFADNCPDCRFTEIDYNTASLKRLPSQVSSALISHPDTDYVVTSVDTGVPGALTGIQAAGFTNKVKISSANGDLAALQRIKAGQVQFNDVGTSPVYFGWQFADGIIRMMVGQKPDEGPGIVRVFNKDNVGDLSLTPAAYATNQWYGQDTFENTFLSAWGVK